MPRSDLVVGPLIWLIGAKAFVLVYLQGLLLAAAIGVWLSYVQNQSEAMTWRDGESWRPHEPALHGSSHYHLPLDSCEREHSPRAPSLQPYALLSPTAGATRLP